MCTKISLILPFYIVSIGLLFCISCSSKNKESAKENIVSEQQVEHKEKEILHENPVLNKINSADIRLELRNPAIDRNFETLEMSIVNNSEYRLSTGSVFTIKFLEFGVWNDIPAFKNTIWTEEEIPVYPQSSRKYEFFYGFYDFDFVPGKYRIEKDVKFVNPIDSNNTHFIGERTLIADFEIK